MTATADKKSGDSDADYWINQARKNADKDLDKWPDIVNSGDHKQMGKQMKLVQCQIMTASKNLKSFVPSLDKFVGVIYKLGGGDSINYVKAAGLKGAVRFLHGRRDHKSYYLFDGVHNWITKRTKALQGKRDDLATEFNQLDNKVVSVRDQLNSDAQKLVQGIGILNDLVADIGTNQRMIKEISTQMYNDAKDMPNLLKNNQELIDMTNKLVNESKTKMSKSSKIR